MKKFAIVLACSLILMGLYQSGRYFLDYDILSQYGKGYVWGSALLVGVGAVLLFFGLRNSNSDD